jgi:hypothetical protein
MPNKKISLREKKYARTKVMIMHELIDQLKTKSFEDVSITDICRKVEISEGTFYNYFPHKLDVLFYFLALDSIRWQWEIAKLTKGKSAFAQIDAFFDVIAEQFLQPHFVYEMIGALVGEQFRSVKIPITDIEKRFSFSACPGIEAFEHCPPRDYFKAKIIEAQKAGDLSKKYPAEDVTVMVHSILCGTALAVPEEKFSNIARYMKKQLAFVWEGLKAR